MENEIVNEKEFLQTFRYKHNKYFIKTALTRSKIWNIIPLKTSDKRLPLLALLSGWLIGDGNLAKATMYFVDLRKEGLMKIKNEILDGFSPISVSGPYKSHGETGVYTLLVNDFSLAHLLAKLNVPVGDKTIVEFGIPRIALINRDTKRMFLAGLLGSEMPTPVFDSTRKYSITSLFFGMAKSSSYKNSHIVFLEKIREMLLEFKIKTSGIKIKKSKRPNERPIYGFYIRKNAYNVLRFYLEIPLIYFPDKYEKFESTIFVLKNKILAEIENLDKVFELSRVGMSTRQIEKMTKIPKSTVWQWTSKKRFPRRLKQTDLIRHLVEKTENCQLTRFLPNS